MRTYSLVVFGRVASEMVGLESFARYLSDTGRKTRVEPEKQRILLEGSPIDEITIRMQGSVGPRANLKNHAFSFSVGPVPIASNQVWPLQYNYIVRGPEEFALRAKLKQKTKGFWERERRGIYWTGAALAQKLGRDEALMADLFEHLAIDDSLEVMPETGKGYTRIIHKTTMSLRYNLLADEIVQLYRGKLPEPLLTAMERIAEICRHPR